MKPLANIALTALLLVLVMSAGGWAAMTAPVTHTLPPVHLVATQTDQRTGTYARQAFILALRPNAEAQIQLAGLTPMVVHVSGRLQVDGSMELSYSVTAAGQTYGPSRMLLRPDAAPVNNTFYLGDLALKLEFQPQSAVSVRPSPSRLSKIDDTSHVEKCDTCRGSGVCQACQGKGHDDCRICNGSGNCSHCHGSAACQNCAGTGQFNGKPCWVCHGTGNCMYCNTKGDAYTPSDGKCSFCQGKGYVTVCAACGGSGKCPVCHGRGHHVALNH